MHEWTVNAEYMLTCGIAWRRTSDPSAGLELVEGLESSDPQVRALAQTLLVEGGDSSVGLLESAMSAGIANPDLASACIAEILRARVYHEWIRSERQFD